MDKVQSLRPNSENYTGNTNVEQYRPLYNAVCGGDLDAVNKFLTDHPKAVTAGITSDGETPLHMAIMLRRLNIIEKLLQLMSADDVLVTNVYGNTHLLGTVADGKNIEIAKWLIKKNDKMLTIANGNGWIPLTFAIECGNTDMARYLYHITPFDMLKPENGDHGARLLIRCYYFMMLDMAFDLLKRCPRLAVTREFANYNGATFVEILASVPLKIQNESQLPYWKAWIYKCVHLLQKPASPIKETPVCIRETSSINDGHMISTSPGIKNMHQAKLARKEYLEIMRAAVKAISPTNEEDIRCGLIALLNAAQHGNAKFIVEAVKAEFSLIWTRNYRDRNVFHLSVEYRQAKVFSLIHGVFQKERFLNFYDRDGNNMLHLAGMLASSTYLNQISGPALQMQRELQWFKEVENIMPPIKRESMNRASKTPRECFTENHEDLLKQGEKWMKGTATSCSVVAALVSTITFAAAFTVPGGNNQDSGYPTFLYEKLFMLFIISDAVSLLSSTTSLLMFLALLTCRYAEDDFLTSLPTKLITGLSTMFISLATMMIAFCATLFLLIHEKKWIIIPVTLLACVPVTLYIWLQLPLLVNMFKSTYRPSIFDRNVKPWP